MKKFMDWMTNVFAPKMNKVARNPWIGAIQESILACMPVIFIGSFVVLVAALGGMIEGFPDFGVLSSFSMGMLSLFLAYLIPYHVMEKKRHNKTKKQAGVAGLALFLMLCGPAFTDEGMTIATGKLGAGGMLAALAAGLFAGFVMNLFASFSFFKKDTQIPDFVTIWFDTLIPMLVILIVGWILVFVLKLDMFDMILAIFSPVAKVGDTFLGFFVLYFIGYAFLYTFGISTWILYPLEVSIIMPALVKNAEALAAGTAPQYLNVYGVADYMMIGGGGATLALSIMFLVLSKSKKNKVIGKAAIVPSICNINEPLVFGAPIAFNPILMIPMWIVGLLVPLTTYLALLLSLVPKVTFQWSFWYAPSPISAFALGGVRGVLLVLFNFALSWAIYYPFFKIYDKQCVKEEQAEAEPGAKKGKASAKVAE